MDSSALAPYFKFYDELVSDWLSNTHYLSEKYLPEPWWGWSDSGKPLYAVVINLNPGDGGILQTRRYIRFGINRNFSYREAMADGSLARHLEGAARWHKAKREKPVLEALGLDATSGVFSGNTLCIELYPFHSKSFGEIEKDAADYLEADGGKAFWRMMEFAAEASRRVEGPLQNKVLIRMSHGRWQSVASKFCIGKAVKDYEVSDGKSGSCASAVEYRFRDNDTLKDISFYCIWNPRGRNNFPFRLAELLAKIGIN